MATPNIVNVTSIYGGTAQLIPSTTSATAAWAYGGNTANSTTSLPGLTPAASSVQKIESIVVSNKTGSAASATVTLCPAATYADGNAANTYLAYQISVPANSTLIVTDKSTSFYLMEFQSIGVTSGTASALTFTASFETIT
jgi:hypothetical protein